MEAGHNTRLTILHESLVYAPQLLICHPTLSDSIKQQQQQQHQAKKWDLCNESRVYHYSSLTYPPKGFPTKN